VPYRRAVIAAGAEPVDLVPGTKVLPAVDGLLLPGGWDVDPSFYGEKRDDKVQETDPSNADDYQSRRRGIAAA
jgi:gamma-glutamyl-gamma-aminobutyrate hydrolase PuuD